MKLTLRTLLAWRDRVLPEQDHLELDQKVAAAELAQKLEQKIRDVLARTELPAARMDSRESATSANRVAEFLDNALEPDLLGPFEQNCVESDVQLCEVAECHQLLAGMAGNRELAMDLDEQERQQLGKAIKRRSEELAAETEHAAGVANARAIRAELDAVEQTEADAAVASPAVPATRRQSRGAAFAAAAAVALLLVLAMILSVQLFRDGADRGQPLAVQQPANAAAPAADVAAADAAVNEPDLARAAAVPPAAEAGADDPAAPPFAAPEEPLAGPPAPPQPAGPAPSPAAPPAASGSPAAAPASSMADRPQVPQGTAMAIAATAAPPQTTDASAAAAAAPSAAGVPTTSVAVTGTPTEDLPVLGFLENDAVVGSGFVLHRSPAADPAELDGWQCLLADAPLAAQEEVMVPPGLNPSFNIAGVQVRLRPRSHAIFKIDSVGMPRVELLAGSLIIRSADEAAQLGLAAGGLNGVLLSGLQGGLAVEVTRLPDSTVAARQTAQTPAARLLPLSQPINWRQTQAGGLPPRVLMRGIDAETELKPSELLEWAETDPLMATRRTIAELPQWATPLRRIPSLEKAASEALVTAATSGDPLLKALIELSVDRRIENRMAAVETLALVGRYDELVELLREPPPTGPAAGLWEQLEGQTIPLAFSDPTLALVLEKAFRDHLAAPQAAAAIGLSRRNLPAASADDLTRRLIDLLEDDELLLRRYAFAWLRERFELEPAELIQYRPDWSPEQLHDGADWWRKRLDKGLLVPRQPNAATAIGEG